MVSQPSTLNSQPRASHRARQGGFALLLTVTLLGFITILLVGLAAFTRIETAIAGNTQRQAQARQNALFAVNVAVAQLQKYAGPDARVTATADAFSATADAQKKRYTGVWDTQAPGSAPVWLASGLETGTSPDPTAPSANGSKVAVVGSNTDGSAALTATGNPGADNVVADLQSISAPGVPGRTGNTVIGKYAWWVGDNGVKADVARGDVTSKLNYEPFITGSTSPTPDVAVDEMKKRLLQQTGHGAGSSVFDPRDTTNTTLAANTLSVQQVPYLRTSATATVGLAALKSHYHSWTVGNSNVLARTNAAAGEVSLRNDLSTNPAPLGTAFQAWANYPSYMQSPTLYPGAAGNTPPENALRRRYTMQPLVKDATTGAQFGIAPVLTFFALSFSIHNSSLSPGTSSNQLDASMRCVASFWNPYTAALVPEDIEMRVYGLPDVTIGDFNRVTPNTPAPLQTLYGDESLVTAATPDDPDNPTPPTTPTLPTYAIPPLRFLLSQATATSGPVDDQTSSWLPGRVYSWSAADSPSTATDKVYPMVFGQRDLQTTPNGEGVVRMVSSTPLAVFASDNSTPLYRHAFTTTPSPTNPEETTVLTIELVRVSDGALLATFKSPAYRGFSTENSVLVTTPSRNLDFAYAFRMKDPVVDGFAWLTTPGVDVRSPESSVGSVYQLFNGGENPAGFVVDTTTSNPLTTRDKLTFGDASLLLDRDPGLPQSPTGTDYNEDVPVFELPRSPLLSIAQLQHLSIPGQTPFYVGQSTAGGAWGNALFDQHFFSGLASGVTWADSAVPLPNTLLRVLRRKPDSSSLAPTDFYPTTTTIPDPNDPTLTITTTSAAGLSAKHVLQGGSFNLNSTDPEAWAAVLRSVRFPAGREFQFLDIPRNEGTASDSAVATPPDPLIAVFPRFSQSAQETYKIDPTYTHQNTGSQTGLTVHTDYYRRGFRDLSAATVTELAQKIATAVETHIRTHGPYTSVQEFLGQITTVTVDPNDPTLTITTTGPSLLEQAIIDLKLNVDPNAPVDPVTLVGGNYPMSSMYLTQADIMTAIGPVLFTRSDTFTVRAYGEANNPVTGATEGKAWCEAIVQRLPEPVNAVDPKHPTDDEYQKPGADGRRFKIISLRWLTRSDI